MHVHPAVAVGVAPRNMSGERLGGRWQRPWGHLALEPGTGSSVPVPALLRGRGCPCPAHPELSRPAESLAGFLLSVNATASLSRLRIPYPQTGSWYLSLRSLCATEHG